MLDTVASTATMPLVFEGQATPGGITYYEFFAGAGMVRLGLGPDWTCLLANDNDVEKATSYARNFSVHALKIDDVACLTAADLPGHADLAWSSFPCQDLSLAGGRAGLGGARSGTFWSFWGLMMALRAAGRAPRLVVIENVCGLITGHGGKDFVALCDAFTEGGYRVGVMVIDAKFFVPQSRDRVFIIGVDATLPIPASIVVDQPALPFHDNAVVKALRRQAAPPIWFKLPVPPPHGLTLRDILDDQGQEWDTSDAVAEIVSKMEKPHLDRLEEDKRAGELVVRGLNYRTRNKVPQWESNSDQIAYCLRTGSGGSNVQRPMFVVGPSICTRKITAPNKTELDRLAELMRTQAEAAGRLKAARKLKAPAAEIATRVAAGKRLTAEIRYARTAELDPRRAHIRLLQVYAGGDRVLVIDLDRIGAGVLDLLDGTRVIAHNIAFELAFLEAANVALGGMQCTLQAVRLVLGEHATSLAAAARAYLNVDLDKSQQVSDWSAPSLTQMQIDYAAIDAVVAWRIAEKILPRFEVQRSAYEIQLGAVPAAMRMEQRGFKLDVEAHARLTADLSEERLAAEQDYCEACQAGGHTTLINKAPSTPAQKQNLLEVLLSSEELQRWRRTEKSGALSTKRSELLRAGHYPPIMALVKLSRIDKVLSSFGQTLAVLASPITGRIYAHYRIANTASGRASCSGPNLQQVPRDPRFRALFVPEPGNVFIIADYASMELRAAAYISEDHAMTKAFEQGLDLHRLTASQMTGKDLADVTDEERKGAKCVNFGSVYGQGAGGLVQSAWDQFDVVLDFDEAKAWLQTFADTYYGFTRWRSVHFRACELRRYIVIGRDMGRGIGRIYPQSRVPEGGSFYTRCCNLPVQGACADASMLALTYVDDCLFDAGIEGGPVAWLHDEIVLEVREDQAELAAEILKRAMIDGFIETFPDAPINGLVKPHIGMSWAEK